VELLLPTIPADMILGEMAAKKGKKNRKSSATLFAELIVRDGALRSLQKLKRATARVPVKLSLDLTPPDQGDTPPDQPLAPRDDIQRLERQIADLRTELERLQAEIDLFRPAWAKRKPNRNEGSDPSNVTASAPSAPASPFANEFSDPGRRRS
jgi:hypothetical protein